MEITGSLSGRHCGRTHRCALLTTSAFIGVALLAQPSMAQSIGAPLPQSEASDETAPDIVITGSRIARRDYQANSPIVTAGSDLLTNAASTAVETNLNKLPQFTPAQTPTIASDTQANATNTPGAASVSLRGLGANRNLVLLDGRRAMPGNANMVVDINSIPSAAIERVEIITGGASATYGADAVGGVVNFILKKNFQGLQLDAQYGITQRGDDQDYLISGIMGANFDDGRGNISMSFATNQRNVALRADRPWFRNLWADPNTGGTLVFAREPAFIPGVNRPSQAILNNIFGSATPAYPTTSQIWFTQSGKAFGFDFATRGGQSRYDGTLDLATKRTAVGSMAETYLDEQLVLPLKRWNIYTRGSYELADWVSLLAQGYFNTSSTRTRLAAGTGSNSYATTIPIAGHPVPEELARILASRTPVATASTKALADLNCPDASASVPGSGANCDWALNIYPLGLPRQVFTDVFTYQMLAGFEGKIPGTSWTWDFTGSHGKSSTDFLSTGYFSLERYRAVIRAPNWGAGFIGTGNQIQGGFGASTATCTSGLNPFDNIATSEDCLEAIAADIKSRSQMQQTNVEANAQGPLFSVPAGEVRAAIGASYRRNNFTYTNDTLGTQGRSFLDQIGGAYPSGNSKGSISVKEFYGELLVPVLSDLPLVKKLELELGARVSDYNSTGTSLTWKALADWQVNDWIRIRGGFNKAERAPNIAEIYQAPQETVTTLAAGDACSAANNTLKYGAGSANMTNRTAVRALCEAVMNRSDPTSAATFYADTQGVGSVIAFVTSQGNPSIKPEEAKTWTLGLVLSSPFESSWTRGLRLSADYYNIAIENAIGAETGDVIQQKCFDIAYNPTLDVNSEACKANVRSVGIGTLANLIGTYKNVGRISTAGIDTQLDWSLDLEDTLGVPGRFTLNSVLSYLFTLKSTATSSPPLEFAGSLGTNQNGLNTGNAYRWKLFSTIGYSVDAFHIGLQWQHLPSTQSVNYPANHATTNFGAPAYDLFHLNLGYSLTQNISLRAGVDNLFDRAPPLTEYNTAPNAAAGQLRGGSLGGGQYYDLIGRRFYVAAKLGF